MSLIPILIHYSEKVGEMEIGIWKFEGERERERESKERWG
jgi:hypothetical protein